MKLCKECGTSLSIQEVVVDVGGSDHMVKSLYWCPNPTCILCGVLTFAGLNSSTPLHGMTGSYDGLIHKLSERVRALEKKMKARKGLKGKNERRTTNI